MWLGHSQFNDNDASASYNEVRLWNGALTQAQLAYNSLLGPDVLVVIWGGSAHIGSVAIAVPRPSGADPRRESATSSVYNFIGHKDEAVSRACAERIAAALNRKTVVSAGIHLDSPQPRDIRQILKNADLLGTRLVRKIKEIA